MYTIVAVKPDAGLLVAVSTPAPATALALFCFMLQPYWAVRVWYAGRRVNIWQHVKEAEGRQFDEAVKVCDAFWEA